MSDFIHIVKRARQFKQSGAVAVLTDSGWWISHMSNNFREWVEVQGWSEEGDQDSYGVLTLGEMAPTIHSGDPAYSHPIPWRTSNISIHAIHPDAYYAIYKYGWMLNDPTSWKRLQKDGYRTVTMPDA